MYMDDIVEKMNNSSCTILTYSLKVALMMSVQKDIANFFSWDVTIYQHVHMHSLVTG